MNHLNYSKIADFQIRLASKVITSSEPHSKYERVCGVDVSYKDNNAFCCAVIFDKEKKKIIVEHSQISTTREYSPGFFMLRESKPIFSVLKKFKHDFDVLLVDGNGQLHPRYCGLACYVGLKLDIPTIGVSKNLLCGEIRNDLQVFYNENLVGMKIKKGSKEIFVSIGNKIDLKTAAVIVDELILGKYWYPEPLRLADFYSKQQRNEFLKKREQSPKCFH